MSRQLVRLALVSTAVALAALVTATSAALAAPGTVAVKGGVLRITPSSDRVDREVTVVPTAAGWRVEARAKSPSRYNAGSGCSYSGGDQSGDEFNCTLS